jgi:hypothetical protein
MYHVELRQFPHNHSRFNLSEGQVRALARRWAADELVEMGERKWNPQQASLTVLQGPQLPLDQLSMGRGWRAAQRQGRDVTEALLAEARSAVAHAGRPQEADPMGAAARRETPAQGGEEAGGGPAALADPLALGVQLASLLGQEPSRLLAAWRAVAASQPGLAPSESLALAERQLAQPDGIRI